MMNVEDETFLSAYLDGELDGEARQRVETAMLSDAGLLDRLHSLAAVREMVATLPRPAFGHDLSGPVTRALRRRRAGFLALSAFGKATPGVLAMRAGALASAAAAVVVAALIGPGGTAPRPLPAPMTVTSIERDPADTRIGLEPTTVPGLLGGEDVASAAIAFDAAVGTFTAAEGRREAERREVRDLLDRPDPARMIVVADAPGSDAPGKVGRLLEQSSLRNARFGRISVSQGVHIDPKHPGKATVFAVVMDESELRDFRKSLRSLFLTSVVEAEARPEVVTQLADLGGVSLSEAKAVPGLRVPEGPTLAMRREKEPVFDKKAVHDAGGDVHRQPDREGTAPPHAPGLVKTHPGSTPSAPAVVEKSIDVDRRLPGTLVLIWVTATRFEAPRPR